MVGKAELLSDHFDSKQCREAVDLLLTCHPFPSLTTFAFRSREVRHLLLDLDPCGGTDPLGMFPLFPKRTADVMAPRLSVVFRRLVRLSRFPACWRQANVTPKVYSPILVPIADQFPYNQYCLRCLSAWCRFVLNDLWNAVVCFQPPSLLIGKVWVPVMHFCAYPIHCRGHWRVGRRLGSCRLTSVQPLIGSTIWEFSISSALWVLEVLSCLYLTQFLSNRSPQVMLDGCWSKLVNVVSGVPQGSILGLLLFLLFTS